jgi:hypothetical protein
MENNIITIRETNERRLISLMVEHIKVNKNTKFILITKINSIKQINKLQKFPVLDIIDYTEKDIQSRISSTKYSYIKINEKRKKIETIAGEKEFEKKLSWIHLIIGLVIVIYFLIKYT